MSLILYLKKNYLLIWLCRVFTVAQGSLQLMGSLAVACGLESVQGLVAVALVAALHVGS